MGVWSVNIGGAPLTLHAFDDESNDLIRSMLSSFVVKITDDKMRANIIDQPIISLRYANRLWKIHDADSNLTYDISAAGDAIYYLTDRIAYHVADRTADAHCLHAAAVVRGRKALLMPAVSGSGKSSFCAWLVSQGYRYLTDELVLLKPTGGVTGLRRPIQIKPQGLEAIANLLEKPEQILAGQSANAISIECLTGLAQEARQIKSEYEPEISGFVFPKYRPAAGFKFTKLPSAEAGLALMGCHVNFRNLENGGFKELMTLVRSTPSYSLVYGGFSDLPENFISQLDALLS